MDDFWSSVTSWFKEKTSSPLYFTYIAFFIFWNWEFFQIIFLEEASLFQGPRIEYISENILLHFSIAFLPVWLSEFIVSFVNWGWHIIPPVFFSYIAIEYFPKIHDWAFDKHVKNHFRRKSVYREENLEYEKKKTKSLIEEVQQKKEQVQQKNIIERIETKEEKWDKEYEALKKNPYFNDIQQIINSIYNYYGRINDFRDQRIISQGVLVLAHTKDLITLDKTKETIELTEKGLYFIGKYSEETNK